MSANVHLRCPFEVLAVLLQHPVPLILPSPILCGCPTGALLGGRRTLPRQREQIGALGGLTMNVAERHPRRLCTCRCYPPSVRLYTAQGSWIVVLSWGHYRKY